jgi:hypothetical protein
MTPRYDDDEFPPDHRPFAERQAALRALVRRSRKEHSMGNDNRPILCDFVIAVDRVETFHVRIRDDMRRGWGEIEQRAIALVEEEVHEPYSEAMPIEYRMGGSWIASEHDQGRGAFQMRPWHCRECGIELHHTQRVSGVTICESCERRLNGVDADKGLYAKYLVFKNDGDPIKNLVGDCFVLRPTTDDAAYDALWTYVDRIEDDPDKQQLADDLRTWLRKIAEDNRAMRPRLRKIVEESREMRAHHALKMEQEASEGENQG